MHQTAFVDRLQTKNYQKQSRVTARQKGVYMFWNLWCVMIPAKLPQEGG